jgi:hypothetical protein
MIMINIKIKTITQYFKVIEAIELTNEAALNDPTLKEYMIPSRIKIIEIKKTALSSVLSRKSIQLPIPRIKSTEGKIKLEILKMLKLLTIKNIIPIRNTEVPINNCSLLFFPNEIYTELIP